MAANNRDTSTLREGFTTGTAASAAAKAGVLRLLGLGESDSVGVPLPMGGRYTVPIASYVDEAEAGGVRVSVTKDGGDDPDATHGAAIQAVVRFLPEAGERDGDADAVRVRGGYGVGRVTRPGLPMAVGRAAINPEPRAQIARAVREALAQAGNPAVMVDVRVEVPDGEAIAQRTLNPRLGIVGGISILGTRGTVKPFSHEAYTATIDQCLALAREAGLDHIALATGGRSERLLRRELAAGPDAASWPDFAFVSVADFFGHSMRKAGSMGMRRVVWGVFFGKLVKQAHGFDYTHAKDTAIDFDLLADWCRKAGIAEDAAGRVADSNTALEALGYVRHDARASTLYAQVAERAKGQAERLSEFDISVQYYLFDMAGELLYSG